MTQRTCMQAASRIISMEPVLGSDATLCTRALHRRACDPGCPSLDTPWHLTAAAVTECTDWVCRLSTNPVRPATTRCAVMHSNAPRTGSKTPAHMYACTDAPEWGLGCAFSDPASGTISIRASSLLATDQTRSSMHRELMGVLQVLQSSAHCAGFALLTFTDAMAACWAFKCGTSHPESHAVVLLMHKIARALNVNALLRWCSRESAPGKLADAASRLARLDVDDVSLWPRSHANVLRASGNHRRDVDSFADSRNAQAKFHCSLLPTDDPRCLGVDAFKFDWPAGCHLAFPPRECVARAMRHKTTIHSMVLIVAHPLPPHVSAPSCLPDGALRPGVRPLRCTSKRGIRLGPIGKQKHLHGRMPLPAHALATSTAFQGSSCAGTRRCFQGLQTNFLRVNCK